MAKYKVGDSLTHQVDFPGFEKITIYRIDDKSYYCKIINGKVDIPISTVDNTYELIKD